jgi:hypothetical protein
MIQAAIDRIELSGGGCVDLGAGHYACKTGPLRLDPTRTTLVGAGALLDFSRRQGATSDSPCLLIIPRSNSQQYGHAPYRLEGIKLLGPGRLGESIAIAFRADRQPLSARLSLYNVDIAAFHTGISIERGCYCTQFYSCSVRDCDTCVRMPPGQLDAGENISFFGCSLANSRMAIDNIGGSELVFVATSFDYLDLWYDGGGIVNFFGCWFEKQKPSSNAPLFRVRSGILFFQGGLLQVSGVNFENQPSNSAVFQIDSKQARVVLDGMFIWNARSSSEALSTGPGRLISRLLVGGDNKQVNGIPNASSRHDLFGGQGTFAGPSIGVEAVVSSGAPDDGHQHSAHYGIFRLGPADARGGQRWLEIVKGGGRGNVLTASFFCPVQPIRIPTVRFKWSVLRKGETVPSRFWAVLSAVQKIGYETNGRPIIGANEPLARATIETAVSEDATAWADLKIDTMMTEFNGDSDGFTSEWATHLRLELNLVDFPSDSTLRIASLEAFAV